MYAFDLVLTKSENMIHFFLVCKCCGWNWNWKLAKLWWIPGFQPRKQRIFCHGWFEQCWILHRATRWGLLRYYSRLWPNDSCFRRKGIFQQSSAKWPRCCYLCWMLEYILNKYRPSGPSNLSGRVDSFWSTHRLENRCLFPTFMYLHWNLKFQCSL